MDEGRTTPFLTAPQCPQAQVALQPDKLLGSQGPWQADLKTPRAQTPSPSTVTKGMQNIPS